VRALTLGVHVLDVLVRPVERIPDGQGGQLVDDIRLTPAGPAGGTAVTLAKILAYAREHGVVTSAEILAPAEQAAAIVDCIAPALEYLDYLLPNEEQVLSLTGADHLTDGCRVLIERGVGCVAATCGPDGALIADREGAELVPAFAVDVVDTTGCGDAFSAGFLRGLALDRGRVAAATLGCACAALVATGLGPDHGDFDQASVDAFAADCHTLPPTRSFALR
jgi:sugar/nucleoside kinase (ribokinase family)